jgi:hypothetical protein
VEEAEWIATFTRTATALYPNDPETVRIVIGMERARFAPVIIDEPELFLSPQIRNAWRSTNRATLGQISPELSDPPPDPRILQEIAMLTCPGRRLASEHLSLLALSTTKRRSTTSG